MALDSARAFTVGTFAEKYARWRQRSLATAPSRHEALKLAFRDIYVAELRRSGSTLTEERLHELLAPDVQLNALGLGTWLDKDRV